MNSGKTGWPPGLLQDDCRPLHKWFASKPDARMRVREVAADIERERCCSHNCNQGRSCETRQACELPEADEPLTTPEQALSAIAWVIATFCAAGLAAAWLPIFTN